MPKFIKRYKVDKKLFQQRQLDESLSQIETRSKYLRDLPLKRSEVDEYNRLKANDWVKNTLVSLGVIFSTAAAIIIFVLLGNMLITNGRSGDIGKHSIDSQALYRSFESERVIDENGNEVHEYLRPIPDSVIVGVTASYKVPYQWIDDRGTETTDDDVTHVFLKNSSHVVYVYYQLKWVPTPVDVGSTHVPYDGRWVVGNVDSIGTLSNASWHEHSSLYTLDVQTVSLNALMTGFFLGQEDGWAKTLIQDFFFTAWPLTLVLWMVFLLTIAGYAVVLVVGIRYVIRSVVIVLRKAGYITSEFVSEVIDAVKSEIPLVEIEEVKDIDFTEMKRKVKERLKEESDWDDTEYVIEDNISLSEEDKPIPVFEESVVAIDEKPSLSETKKASPKSKKTSELDNKKNVTEKIKDVFE